MDISNVLRTFENDLFTNSIRKSADRVSSLLTEDFREFGSSGKTFSKETVISTLQSETPQDILMLDFEAKLLSDDVALVTYRSIKRQVGVSHVEALRSSIWILRNSQWQMIFHQGTKIL